MSYSAKDLITDTNISRTYKEGKYICFVLRNGITVKLDPNERKEDQVEEKENVKC